MLLIKKPPKLPHVCPLPHVFPVVLATGESLGAGSLFQCDGCDKYYEVIEHKTPYIDRCLVWSEISIRRADYLLGLERRA